MYRYQLSLPGPAECDPDVLKELSRPILPHYGDLWIDYYRDILKKLKIVYQTENSVYVLPSSGSGAIDATFANLFGKEGLVLDNGSFGQRLTEISSHYLNKVDVIYQNPGEPFQIKKIKDYLKKNKIDLLAVVHGETSVGMLNHLEDLSELCQENNILFIIDAVSTLGGVDLPVDKLGIDFCISASQKALGSIPGLSTISISQKGWNSMPSENNIPAWYFNFKTWQRYEQEWEDWHPFPVTLPVHLFFALGKALDIILEEGLEKRFNRHKHIMQMFTSSLEEVGISLFIKEKKYLLPTATAAVLPERMTSKALQDFLKDKYNILIAGGVGPTKKHFFRVGHMAYSANEYLINRVISAIKEFILK